MWNRTDESVCFLKIIPPPSEICVLYRLLLKDPLWVSIQLRWLLHISCFILNFAALSDMDEGHKRSAGLHTNLQWYSNCDDCRHTFDLTCFPSNFHFNFRSPHQSQTGHRRYYTSGNLSCLSASTARGEEHTCHPYFPWPFFFFGFYSIRWDKYKFAR